MTDLKNRYDFVFFFDVANGNPNGDPDAGNLPRMDPETGQGLVSDVSIKRKIRNYVADACNGKAGHAIYVTENAILNEEHRKAYAAIRKDDEKVQKAKSLSPQNDKEAAELRAWMCANFFDIRTFGAVMSTGINCGQVRGPLQFVFGRSEEPIMPLEISITRMAATNEAEKRKRGEADDDARGDNRTMGRKHIVPYGLYRAHGFVNAKLAQKTGFSTEDLALVREALTRMYDLDRSAARGEMAARRAIAFRHDSDLGNAPAHKLFDRVTVHRIHDGTSVPVGDKRSHNWPPARAFANYEIRLNEADLPPGITVEHWV
ncbi:MAG: type I-C CRISPR-associated protein Cas7/Csd2 [Hyphomicrobiaceae bacterium]